MNCISTAEFLGNAGPPPQCLCGQPTLPHCQTTWQCPPESVCNMMWYVIPYACRAGVAAFTGVACYGNVAGRVVCSITTTTIAEAMGVCPEIGPPISAAEALSIISGEGGSGHERDER